MTCRIRDKQPQRTSASPTAHRGNRVCRRTRTGASRLRRTARPLRLEPLELRALLSADLFDALLGGPRLLDADPAVLSQAAPLEQSVVSADTCNSVDMSAALAGLSIDTSSYDATSIIVRLQADADVESLMASVLPGGQASEEVALVPGLRKVDLPGGTTVEDALARLGALDTVLYAQPNYYVHLQTTGFPNDPNFSSQWDMNNTGQTGGTTDADIDAPEAWAITAGNPSIVVAVLDTGVDYTHPDLAANIWTNPGEIAGDGIDNDGNGFIDDVHGWDFQNEDNDPMDDHGHGTHVAGTIAAVGNNGVGVAGVAWNVTIMPLKIMSSSGTSFDAIQALNYAVAMGVKISNNSYYMSGMYNAIEAAGAAGHLFVTAAGNSGVNTDITPHYPSIYDLENIISVAATDHNDNKLSSSNYGLTTVDLGAPGANIYSTKKDGGYGNMSGTSTATPHVTGTAALIKSLRPEWSVSQIKDAILSTVNPIPALDGKTVTGGRLNAAAAVAAANPVSSAPPVAVNDAIVLDEGGTTATLVGGSNNLLNNDTDADLPADTLTVVTTPVVDVNHGSLTLHSNGTFSYAHDGSQNLTDSFVYKVKDATGHWDTATVSITVNPVNDAPVLTVPGAQSATEDTVKSITGISVADADAATGAVKITMSIAHGRVTFSTDRRPDVHHW